MAPTFHIVTFGCKVNQYETQALREAWLRAGAIETPAPEEASVILVNSCAVTAVAVSDLRQAVRRLHREAPKAEIILTGCAAARAARIGERPAEALGKLPGVAAIVDPRRKDELQGLFASAAEGCAAALPRQLEEPPCRAVYPPFSIEGFCRARPVLKVQDGCSHGCAYCIVPLTRGPSRSRSAADIIAEARRLLEAGYTEIMLSGINLRQYACHDEGCRDFWALLAKIEARLAPEWAGKARFRLSSVEPGQLDDRGLDALAASRLVCPHLHISLQSGSESVLVRMGRGHYRSEELLRAAERIRQFWPVFGLGADILTGFPGETPAEAAETLEFVRELPLTYAHIFPYSERPGTRAAVMPFPVPVPERKRRAAVLRGVVNAKLRAFRTSLVGVQAMIASTANGDGLAEWYVPCRLESGLAAPHSLVPVTVVAVEAAGLVGRPRH